MTKHLFLAFPLAMLVACGGSHPEHDKMMADHQAMLTADSANKATADQMKQAAQGFLDAWWTGKTDGLDAVVAESFTTHMSMPGVTSTGVQKLKDMIAMSSAAFSENKAEDLHLTAEGDRVILHYRWKGKNTGAMGEGMPATNASVDVNCVDILRFENGKIVEHWGYMEEMKMMEQLGMMGGAGDQAKK
ncbi:MAG: ester cyclase [Flavobacteriales bacterium]|nr:ester cyclase [Flavobacteriales bacterium]HRH67953.1 ester cyclase [Flavobacteriales bacterium]